MNTILANVYHANNPNNAHFQNLDMATEILKHPNLYMSITSGDSGGGNYTPLEYADYILTRLRTDHLNTPDTIEARIAKDGN